MTEPPEGSAELIVLTGARAGHTLRCARPTISVGRAPESDLRFDPERDLAVSARHAVLLLRDGAWHVRDLGSRNGTLVNGVPVHGETPLAPGDRIAFGAEGPTVELRLPRSARRRSAAAAALALGLVLLGALYAGWRQRAGWERERTEMRLEIDSLQGAGTQAVTALERQLQELGGTLRRSEEQVRSLRQAVARAESAGEPERVEGLRLELREADAALRSRRSAATLDLRAIQERSRHAVARLFAEFDDGVVATGTAFAVRPDATLLTSRHVVAGTDGRARPRRIAVQFADSEQVWPARLLAVADDADVAVVKVDNIVGAVPVVSGLNLRADTLPVGAPVSTIGFPLGGETPGPERAGFAHPLLSTGVVLESAPDRLEVEGYGAAGASGSPILDANGEVVAVVFGGRSGGGARSLFGTPARRAALLLESLR